MTRSSMLRQLHVNGSETCLFVFRDWKLIADYEVLQLGLTGQIEKFCSHKGSHKSIYNLKLLRDPLLCTFLVP